MLKYLRLIIVFIFISTTASAQNFRQKFELGILTGFQNENFHWSIAGNTDGTSPNILSELKWMNIKGINTAIQLKWNIRKRLSLSVGLNKAFTVAGKVTDRDYSADNRQSTVYTGNFTNDKGFTSSINLSAAYEIIHNSKLRLRPGLGYISSSDLLFLVDRSNQIQGLNSTYQTRYSGPFIEFKSDYAIAKHYSILSSLTYSQVKYKAKGDWNLRAEFAQPVSYRHTADAYGIEASLGAAYSITDRLAVKIESRYFFWQTGNGSDQLFLRNGNSDKTQLNGVIKNGLQFNLGLNLRF